MQVWYHIRMIISRHGATTKIKGKDAVLSIEPDLIKVNDFIIDSPGEYEVSSIFVEMIDSNAYVFNLEGMNIGYLKENKISDKVNNVDILITNNKKTINQIEPKLVIFIKDINKILIKKQDLPKEGTKIWKSLGKK